MKTHILSVDGESLLQAKQIIDAGGVVAFHTETVYGLGANAFCDEAVQSIFALKGRPADNPLIAHVHEDYDVGKLVDKIPPYAEKLARAYLPGPLTMVYPSKGKVSRFVSCGLDTLAVRVPSSETAQAFLKEVDLPIAAPSANRSRHVSPVTARHVYDDFAGDIPLILDGGACSGGIESTVLDCTGEIPMILRAGLVTREMIAEIAGDCLFYEKRAGERPKSPGMAYKHYAPGCRTAYFTSDELQNAVRCYLEEEGRGGLPYFLCREGLLSSAEYRVLSLGDCAEDMARTLYTRLREGERKATLLVAIEPKERGGVMDGVLNRFTRAFGRETDET